MKRRSFFVLFVAPAAAFARKGGCEEVVASECSDAEFVPKWNNFANDGNAYVMGRKVGIRDAKLRNHMIHRWKDLVGCL